MSVCVETALMGGAGAGTFHLDTGNTVWFVEQEHRKEKFQLSNSV